MDKTLKFRPKWIGRDVRKPFTEDVRLTYKKKELTSEISKLNEIIQREYVSNKLVLQDQTVR